MEISHAFRHALIAMAISVFAAGVASADECSGEVSQRARAFYEEGAKHYHLNEFADAAELFKQSYKICPSARVLYNIGQSYRLMGDNEKAALFYRQYLSTVGPDDPYRQDVAKLLITVQDEIKKKNQVREAPPTGTAPPPTAAEANGTRADLVAQPAARKPIYKKGWFWAVIGSGAIVVAGAVVVGVVVGTSRNPLEANFR